MNTLHEDYLALLGLDAGDRVDHVWSRTLERPAVPYGQGKTSTFISAALLAFLEATSIFASPSPREAAPVAAREAPATPALVARETLPFELRYHVSEPRVLRIEARGAVHPLRGEVKLTDDGVWLYAPDGGASAALVVTNDGEFVVTHDGDSIDAFRIVRAMPAELEPLRNWQPTTVGLSVEVIPPQHALAGYSCQDWLRSAAEDLSSGATLLDPVAALGLLARQWAPGTTEERAALKSGEHRGPGELVVEWAARLSTDDARRLEDAAIAEAGRLLGLLDRMRDEAPQDPDGAMADAKELVQRRDDLESVSFVLSSRRAGTDLRRWLLRVDGAASELLTIFPPVEAMAGEERWQAVFVNEPDLWWGAYGRG